MIWQYGTCNGLKARKHPLFRNVQMLLWEKGEKGHKKNYWIDFHEYWNKNFKANNKIEGVTNE